jgi:hypothetical protein
MAAPVAWDFVASAHVRRSFGKLPIHVRRSGGGFEAGDFVQWDSQEAARAGTVGRAFGAAVEQTLQLSREIGTAVSSVRIAAGAIREAKETIGRLEAAFRMN